MNPTMKSILILFTAVGLALSGCQDKTQPDPTVNTKDEKYAIEATLTNYEAALNASDVDGVLALYAEDGVFMPTEAPTAVGKEQIRTAYEHVFGVIKLDIAFTIDEIVQYGDFAFARTLSRGEVTVLAEDVTLPEENRELFVMKKTGDEWQIAQYMFNKLSPPASQ